MRVEELTEALHRGDRGAPLPPDPGKLRSMGRRRRWRVRAGVGASAVLVAAVVGAAGWGVAGSSGGSTPPQVGVAAEPGARTLSSYEKRVLREVPGAYPAGGVVVVPTPVDTTNTTENTLLPSSQLPRPLRSLGFPAMTDPGYVASSVELPRFMRGNIPDGSQVLAAIEPISLTCAQWKPGATCQPAVVVPDGERGAFYLYGLGTDHFLDPGHGMELFLDDTVRERHVLQSVIGGLDGTKATTVVLTLTDGHRQDATIDSGQISPGDTMFWGVVDGSVARVTAYDDQGDVVATHRVRACSGGVDCEVR